MSKLIPILLGLGLASSASAALIAGYDFNGKGGTTVVNAGDLASSAMFAATTNDANVTASNIGVGSGLASLTYVSNANEDYFQINEGNGMNDGVHADGGDISPFVNQAYRSLRERNRGGTR